MRRSPDAPAPPRPMLAALHRATAGSRPELTAVLGIAAGVLSVALLLLAPSGWPALVGALVLATVPGGAAVMCWIDTGDDAAQAGLTLAISLTVFAIAGAIMIWAATWQPRLLLALAGASVVSGAARLCLPAAAGPETGSPPRIARRASR